MTGKQNLSHGHRQIRISSKRAHIHTSVFGVICPMDTRGCGNQGQNLVLFINCANYHHFCVDCLCSPFFPSRVISSKTSTVLN